MLHGDTAPLPLSLAPHRQRGNYHGAFRSLAELGNCLRLAVGVTAGLTVAGREALVRGLHECGDLCVLEHEDAVHVFARAGSDADRVLASERGYVEPDHDGGPAFSGSVERHGARHIAQKAGLYAEV
jgi:hypothetical protein